MEIDTELKFLVFIPIASYLFSIHLDTCYGRKIPIFSAENVETLFTESISHVMAHRIGDYMNSLIKLIQKQNKAFIFCLV